MNASPGKAPIENQLHEAAARIANFDDFGDDTHRLGLRALLEAFESDYELTGVEWESVHFMIRALLVGRLYAHRAWTQDPNLLSAPIRAPLFIAGLPRTGTTALHRLLCVDPQFQGPEFWLSLTPMTRPDRHSWNLRPEYRNLTANLATFLADRPSSSNAHKLAADEVEECFYILNQTFFSHHWGPTLPSYAAWLSSQDMKPSYRYYANVLRLIGAREPQRKWLLKYPLHMMEIESLFAAFPDARIIQTHRDPTESIPSWYSLYRMTGGVEATATPRDCNCLGQNLLNYARQSLDRMQEARARRPMHFFDVDYRRFLHSPLVVIGEIYERFGLTLDPKVERGMRDWIAARPRARDSRHRYVLRGFDVSAEQMLDAFEDYRTAQGFDTRNAM